MFLILHCGKLGVPQRLCGGIVTPALFLILHCGLVGVRQLCSGIVTPALFPLRIAGWWVCTTVSVVGDYNRVGIRKNTQSAARVVLVSGCLCVKLLGRR